MKKTIILLVLALVLLVSLTLNTPSAAQDVPTAEVFVQGTVTGGGANGIFFTNDGNLLVAAARTYQILEVDPESGDVLTVYPAPWVDDVTVGPDGSIYYTNIVFGMIGRIAPDGESTVIAEGLGGPNPITMSADGETIYAADCFLGDPQQLYEIDLTGQAEPRVIVEGIPFCASNGIDVGPDGLIYGPRWFENTIVATDPMSGEVTVVYESDSVISAVKFDSMGNLYATDTQDGAVLRIDTATGEAEVIAETRPGLDNLAFDANDRLYISSYWDGFVAEVLDDGSLRMVIEPGMTETTGLGLLNGVLYSGDGYGMRGLSIETGETIFAEHEIFGVGGLLPPDTIVADGDFLLMSSWGEGYVKVYDPVANEDLEVYEDFNTPMHAVRWDGNLVVAELGTNSVVRDVDGEREILLGDLTVPAGLAVGDSVVYVSDWGTGTIHAISSDGTVIVAEGLQAPEGIAIDGERLLVVETGTDTLLAVDLVSGDVSPVASIPNVSSPPWEGFPVPPTFSFNEVVVDADGTIYVNADAANVIYRIQP